MKLFYRQIGESGPAFVILHGIFGSSDNWLSVSKTIAEAGYRVYLLDQRNHGRSPHSDVHNYDSMASDLKEFIEDHQLDVPILLGHSMGGKTVMQFAMNYPGEFQRLVVVDIAPKFYPIHHSGIIHGLNAIDLKMTKNRNEADEILSQYEPLKYVRQFLLKNLHRDEQGDFSWRLNLPIIKQELHGIGEELRRIRPVYEPTLFMRGSESPYILDDDLPTIGRIFPNATVETISGAGHWIQAEKPVEFVEALFRFLPRT